MALKLKIASGKAVFEFEEGGMTASWTLSPKDSGPALTGKLERMLAFLRREEQAVVAHRSSGIPPVVASEPRITSTLSGAPVFTGIPPIQPPPLQDSLLAATANGWEMYDGTEDD